MNEPLGWIKSTLRSGFHAINDEFLRAGEARLHSTIPRTLKDMQTNTPLMALAKTIAKGPFGAGFAGGVLGGTYGAFSTNDEGHHSFARAFDKGMLGGLAGFSGAYLNEYRLGGFLNRDSRARVAAALHTP
jgi:hypothetical protein